MAIKIVGAKAARESLPALLDEVAKGHASLIVRNSKPAALLLPPDMEALLGIVEAVLRETGESIAISRDSEIIDAVRAGEAEIAAGKYVTERL